MSEHPLVQAYLADLDRALVGSDPREHQDTLDAVREHLEEALGEEPTSDDVRRVLAGLGSVDAIAAGTTPVVAPPAVTVLPAAPAPGRADPGALVALVASLVAVLTLFLSPYVAIPLALVALVVAILRVRRPSGRSTLAWSALVVSGTTLVLSTVLGLLLIAVGDSSPEPGPVHSEPAAER